MPTLPKTHTLIGMFGVTALIGAALTAPAQAADFTYDFNSLTPGALTGQDGWYKTRSGWGDATIASATAPGGTSNMVENIGNVTGCRALPTGTFQPMLNG